MKKKMVFLIVIISLILIGVTIMIILLNNGHEIKEFTISDYQYYIDNYGTEKYLGSVVDYRDAEKKAESFWLELYGKDIKNKRPYVTSFDSNNEIWLVSGSLPKNRLGGVPHILLRKSDGKVLAVWHEK